jgi:hypothetical protein
VKLRIAFKQCEAYRSYGNTTLHLMHGVLRHKPLASVKIVAIEQNVACLLDAYSTLSTIKAQGILH